MEAKPLYAKGKCKNRKIKADLGYFLAFGEYIALGDIG